MRTSTGRIVIEKRLTYDNIKYGNKYNQRKGVKVRENVIGKTVSAHRCSLRRKVVTQLVICQPYYRLGIVG